MEQGERIDPFSRGMKIFYGKDKVYSVLGLSGSYSCVVHLKVYMGPSTHQKPLLLY